MENLMSRFLFLKTQEFLAEKFVEKIKFFWFYTCTKKIHHYMFLKIKDLTNVSLYFIKNKVCFVETGSRSLYFWDTAIPCGSEISHIVLQPNLNEDKYGLFTS